MKKIVTTFILLTLCCVSKAQILNSNLLGLESVTYEFDCAYPSADKSQKIMQYTPTKHILLNRDISGVSHFYLIQKDNGTIIKQAVIEKFVVNDFAILGDSIYFCGYHIKNGSKAGFIAYVSINDMFFTGQNYHYSSPQSVYNIFKIFAYYNDEGRRTVAAIGRQKYGEVSIHPIGGDEVPTGPVSHLKSGIIVGQNSNYYWMVASPTDRDCLISYNITQTLLSNNTYNNYDIYYADTNEVFGDMVLTNKYLCIVSKLLGNSTYNHLIRRIDRNNITNQITNKVNSLDDIENNQRLEHLSNDVIAWAYCTENNSTQANVIYKIDLTTSPFTPKLSSIMYDANDEKCKVWDLEYLPKRNQLLVLKQQSTVYNVIEDYVCYVNMRDNTIFPYATMTMRIPDSTPNQYTSLSNLLKYSNDNFVISGIGNNKLLMQDKSIQKFYSTGYCNNISMRNVAVMTHPIIVIYNNNQLQHCIFATTTAIYHLPAQIQAIEFSSKQQTAVINQSCTNFNFNITF